MIWGSMYLRHMVFTELNADKNDLCLVFYLSLTQLKKYHFLSSIPYHWTILTLFHMKLKKPETFISFFITLDFKISNFYVNLHIYIQITKGKKWLWPNKCLTTEKKIILNVSHNLWVLKLLILILTHFLALLAKETLSFHYTREIRLTSLPSSQNLSTLILPIARDS